MLMIAYPNENKETEFKFTYKLKSTYIPPPIVYYKCDDSDIYNPICIECEDNEMDNCIEF